MTQKDNTYLIENKKPVETVCELKNEVPSFEEFLQTYEYDEHRANLYEDEYQAQESGVGPCCYRPYVVNSHKVAGKHIDMCGDLDCSYYRRIVGNRAGGTLGTTASIGAGVGFFTAMMAVPFTGGASLAVAASLSAAASVSAVGGTALTVAGVTETLNGIENELRLKYESEKAKERVSSLQNELNKVKSELREAIKERDDYKRRWGSSDSDYLRERTRVERLENQVKNLKRKLCEERGCGCGGHCL